MTVCWHFTLLLLVLLFHSQRTTADSTSRSIEAAINTSSTAGDDVTDAREKRYIGNDERSSWLDEGPMYGSWGFSAGNLPVDRDFMMKLLQLVKSRQRNRQIFSLQDSSSGLSVNKRNLASLAASNNLPRTVVKKFERSTVPPTGSPTGEPKKQGKRSVASLARDGKLPNIRTKKDAADTEASQDDELSPVSPTQADDTDVVDYLTQTDGENITASQSLDAEKRHISSIARANSFPKQYPQEKRYFGSLLKSQPPSFITNDYNKRHFASVLGSLREDSELDKRFYASLLKSDTPPQTAYLNMMPNLGKRHFSSLLKSSSFPFLSGKRYFASLLKSPLYTNPAVNPNHQKRFDESAVDNLPEPTEDSSQTDLDDTQDIGTENLEPDDPDDEVDVEKRYLASLLKHKNSDSSLDEFSEDKRHIGSLRSKKSDDGSSEVFTEDKRHLASLFKPRRNSDFPDTLIEEKRHLASLLRSRKSEDSPHGFPEDSEMVKRYLASLLKNSVDDDEVDVAKRYFASLLESRDTRDVNELEKRHYSSLLKHKNSVDGLEEEDIDKQYFASPMKKSEDSPEDLDESLQEVEDDMSTDSADLDKRHIASLLNNIRTSDSSAMDKRYYASLLRNRESGFGPSDQSVDKRHFSSLLKSNQLGFGPSDQSADKRHFSSLLKSNQLGFGPSDQSADKRHFSSLLKSRQLGFGPSDQSADKRHFSSLLKSNQLGFGPGDQSVDKRHFSSLLNSNQLGFGPNDLSADKRHIGSLFQNRQSSFGPDDLSADKRHISSLLKNRQSGFGQGVQSADKRSSGSALDASESEDDASHIRRKRYIGALARSNNMPYPYSRSRQNRRDAPNTPKDNAAYLERLIRLEIKKGLLRERQRHLRDGSNNIFLLLDSIRRNSASNDAATQPDKRNIQSLARNGNLYMHRAYKRGEELDDETGEDYIDQDDVYTEDLIDDTYPPLPDVSKRFLGPQARSSWFPRRYRGGYVFDLSKRVFPAMGPREPVDQEDVDVGVGDTGAFYTYSF